MESRAPLDSPDYNDFPHLKDPHRDPDPNEFADETDETDETSDLLTLSTSLPDPVIPANTPEQQESPNAEKTPQPGITAASVMAGLLRSIKMGYEKCFTKAEAQLIEHFITTAQKEFPIFSMNGMLMRTVSALPLAWQSRFFNTAVLPAYDHYLLARKFMVRRMIVEKILEGVTNVVTIGAGFETASLFFSADFPEVMFYDIEQDPTYSTRVKALDTIPQTVINSKELGVAITTVNDESGSYSLNDNYKLIRADLKHESIITLLNRHNFQPREKTLVIAEAVLMYLDEEAVKFLLEDLSNLGGDVDENVVYIYASFMNKNKLSPVSAKAQGDSNELIKSVLPPEKVLAFMDGCGLEVEAQFEPVSQLDRVSDMEYFEFYQKDTEKPREQFYLLASTTVAKPNQNKRMVEIPVLELIVDHALLPDGSNTAKPDCSVM